MTKDEVNCALDKMILSASGWRGVFAANCDEEGTTKEIPQAHKIICGAAAFIFAEYLQESQNNPLVLIGTDTRPTGKAITDTMIPVLLAAGCNVRFSGITAAPEIMAWARSAAGAAGFIYISASHNPVGHNGIKFGLTDGGVLAAGEANKLIANFRSFFKKDDCIQKIETLISAVDPARLKSVYDSEAAAKAEAFKAYYDFCGVVVWGGDTGGNTEIASALKAGLAKRPLGVACDFNGCARTVSVDKDFFCALGLKFDCINGRPGEIAHRIVPEGESLEPCKALLEKAHARDASFLLGYVPDCDGDRGNLVIWDDIAGKARALEAQEVFALACTAELAHLVRTGTDISKAAVAINDPTSMRVDRIAEAFGVSVFRAEVGEANVVGLARRLREQGYIVRILGEGSAGGNITHPSAVRDPINTVLAIVKLLSVRSGAGKDGLFEIWCKCSGQAEKYREDFTLADIIASLPPFASTPAYSDSAVLRINSKDHTLLKNRYQKVFLREWENRKDELKSRYGFCGWEARAYNGLEEKRGISKFGEAGRGGLKILFFDGENREAAYIWMRGSATEPVFRIMADVCQKTFPGNQGAEIERFLLDWQRGMILESDK
ncbi:MAG: phosphatidylglycerol lysyltransferase [Treponema sp.]|jgi:phosphoglucomutase|nr:phosphatidylglycerol lysyltransferase [Treponema sp.]